MPLVRIDRMVGRGPRLYLLGCRCHHGLAGAVFMTTGVLLCHHPVGAVFAGAGALLMAHDRQDFPWIPDIVRART